MALSMAVWCFCLSTVTVCGRDFLCMVGVVGTWKVSILDYWDAVGIFVMLRKNLRWENKEGVLIICV